MSASFAGPAVPMIRYRVSETFYARQIWNLVRPSAHVSVRQSALTVLCRLFPEMAWFYEGLSQLALHGSVDRLSIDRMVQQEVARRACAGGLR